MEKVATTAAQQRSDIDTVLEMHLIACVKLVWACLLTCGAACGQGEEWPFRAWELKVTDGLMNARQLLLRMPTLMVHVIDDDSPLADWCTGRAAVAADSDSEFVIVVGPAGAPVQRCDVCC